MVILFSIVTLIIRASCSAAGSPAMGLNSLLSLAKSPPTSHSRAKPATISAFSHWTASGDLHFRGAGGARMGYSRSVRSGETALIIPMTNKPQFASEQSEAGEFQRQEDAFRDWISTDG